ncbi:MAG: cation diffusion facilitator family transporter [Acidimicrobiales bacterium]
MIEHHDHDHEQGQGHSHGRGRHNLLTHLFGAHSHEPGDRIDSHLEASSEGLRAVAISLGGLGATAVLQVVVVAVSGSVALLADTIHNFSDAVTAIPLGLAFVLSRRRPTRRYTYGYGRAEDLAGIFIVAMIALSAGVAAWQAIGRLLDPQDVHQAGWVAIAGLIGFAGNEAVAVHRIRVGRRIGSASLVADGHHARTDGLTSLAVLGAAVGSMAGWRLADPIIGVAISLAIVNVLRLAARDIYGRLMDAVDPVLVDQVDAQLAAAPGVRGVERVRVRWIGHQLQVDADVTLDAYIGLTEAHQVLEETRHRLLHDIPRLADALLHASPRSDHGDPHAITRHHFAHR